MALNVIGSGLYDTTKKQNTSYQSFTFFSGQITTTDAFTDNDLEFGVGLCEMYLINTSGNPAAYQFEELFGTIKASGIIPANNMIVLRRINRQRVRVCSLNSSSAATVYVQGN